jgi:hypothetical protein
MHFECGALAKREQGSCGELYLKLSPRDSQLLRRKNLEAVHTANSLFRPAETRRLILVFLKSKIQIANNKFSLPA